MVERERGRTRDRGERERGRKEGMKQSERMGRERYRLTSSFIHHLAITILLQSVKELPAQIVAHPWTERRGRGDGEKKETDGGGGGGGEKKETDGGEGSEISTDPIVSSTTLRSRYSPTESKSSGPEFSFGMQQLQLSNCRPPFEKEKEKGEAKGWRGGWGGEEKGRKYSGRTMER